MRRFMWRRSMRRPGMSSGPWKQPAHRCGTCCRPWLAYDEQGLCGMILGDAEPFYNGTQFQIREFCVDNSRRGQGLGTNIYQELERRLQQRGIGEIILYTLRHPAAEGFYNKMGLQANEEMVFMQKKLS